MSNSRLKPTYANVVATLALVIAIAGAGGAEAVADAVKKLAPNSVATKNIRNNAVTSAKVQDHTLTADDVAAGSLGGAEIKEGSLGGADIADKSLGSQDLGDGQIFDPNLATGSVNSRVIQNGSISSDDIADGTIGTDDLADGSIGTDDLADSAVTGDDIADGSITGDDLAPDSLPLTTFNPAAIAHLTHMWDALPIEPASTLIGYSGIAYVAGEDPGPTPEKRSLAISFPAPVTGIAQVEVAPTASCSGSFVAPTSSAGILCIYPRDDGPGHGENEGTFALLDFSNFGALLKYTPLATGWTYAQLSWAFTRPVV